MDRLQDSPRTQSSRGARDLHESRTSSTATNRTPRDESPKLRLERNGSSPTPARSQQAWTDGQTAERRRSSVVSIALSPLKLLDAVTRLGLSPGADNATEHSRGPSKSGRTPSSPTLRHSESRAELHTAQTTDLLDTLRLTVLPVVLLSLVMLFPVAEPGTTDHANLHFFAWGWLGLYCVILYALVFLLLSLLLPMPSMSLRMLTTAIGTACTGSLVLGVMEYTGDPSLIPWTLPISIVLCCPVVFGLSLYEAIRLRTMLQERLLQKGVDLETATTVAIEVEGRAGHADTYIEVSAHSLLQAPVRQWFFMMAVGSAIVVNFATCIIYMTAYNDADEDTQILLGSLFSVLLYPVQTAAIVVGNMVDAQDKEVRYCMQLISKLSSKHTSAQYAVSVKYFTMWAARLFQTLYYRALFLRLKSFQAFATVVGTETCITLFLYVVRPSKWWFANVEWRLHEVVRTCTRSRWVEEFVFGFSKETMRALPAAKKQQQADSAYTIQVVGSVSEEGDVVGDNMHLRDVDDDEDDDEIDDAFALEAQPHTARTQQEQEQHSLDVMHRNHTYHAVRRYFVYSTAQRVSILVFFAEALIMRYTYNAPFFSFSQAALPEHAYLLVLQFAALMAAIELLISTGLWLLFRKAYGLCMYRVGARDLSDQRLYILSVLMAVHVAQDVLLVTTQFSFS